MSLLAYVASPLWLQHASANDPIIENVCNAEKLAMFPGGWPKKLDANIWWYGPDNQVERATGNKSHFYDPSRKTIVFMDGFNGLYHVQSCHRMTSKCVPLARCEEGSMHIADAWVAKGWNFGIFYWDQLADEDCYYAAELKIWGYVWPGSVNKGHRLTWNSYDTVAKKKETRNYQGMETSVAQLCASALRSAMPTFQGGSLQIAGFSLGTQLAAACADVMYQQTPTHPAVPTLTTLLEPAFSGRIKPWSVRPLHICNPAGGHQKGTLRWTVDAVERLWKLHNVPTMVYKSSLMTRTVRIAPDLLIGAAFDPGVELDVLGTLVRWTPSFCGEVFQLPCQHDVIVPFYFFGMRDSSYDLENAGPTSGQCRMPGPQCTDAEIRDIVAQRRAGITRGGKQQLWKQVRGMLTWTIEDDAFRWDVSSDGSAPLPASGLYNLGGYFAFAHIGSQGMLAAMVMGLISFLSIGFAVGRAVRRSNAAREAVFMDEGEE